MRSAEIYFKENLAGILTETDTGFRFDYDSGYLESANAQPISLTMPLSRRTYESAVLFPAFDGLIPEGWLLDVALRNADVSILDRMALLLLCCKDCIGALSVVEIRDGKEVENV